MSRSVSARAPGPPLLNRLRQAARPAGPQAPRFHDRILARAGNSLLISVMEPVDGRLRWLTRQNEEWPQLLAEHRELYEAIASGDPARARTHALHHVQANYRSTVRHLFGDQADQPDPPVQPSA